MARRGTNPPSLPEHPRLLKRRANAAELVKRQIEAGEQLLEFSKTCASPQELNDKRLIWSDYTQQLLKTLFTTEEVAKEFQTMWGGWDPDPRKFLRNEIEGIQYRLRSLHSIFARLDLFEEASHIGSPEARAADESSTRPAREIFVVHGRDEAVKQAVARFLDKLNLSPIILHEQPDKGRTVIQKFEDHADVGFAVVLLTPDDEGRLKEDTDFRPRARQNVILELGYFLGKLGRARVCALKADGVEEPSDLHGVLYISFDPGGQWRLTLVRELKAAGIDVDMNRAL
jgi:predicted nucleotide-binding protein